MSIRSRRLVAVIVMLGLALASIWLIDRRVQRSIAEHQSPAPAPTQPAAETVE
jgi:hypothetical protein